MRDLGWSARQLASNASWVPHVSAWRDGVMLADEIPVSSGSITWDTTQQVQQRLTAAVPPSDVVDGRRRWWVPRTPDDPLARYGQYLDVSVECAGIRFQVGQFPVDDWGEPDGTVQVTAPGWLKPVSDDRFLTPTTPRTAATMSSEFARLLPGYLQGAVDESLVDRPVSTALQWDDDRLAALYSITDAWPARLRVDEWGTVRVLPPLPDGVIQPVLRFTDGEGGTIVSAPQADTREGGYNIVVASSSADGVVASGIARVEGGPMDPDVYRPVPLFWSSPLLLTDAQCVAAARTRLRSAVVQAQTVQVTMPPDPRVEIDDPVEVVTDKGTPLELHRFGWVIGMQMPLTADVMQVSVGVM